MHDEMSPAVSLNDGIPDRQTSMKIVGVGGAGGNAVDRLKMEDLGQVSLAVINTDAQALASSPVEAKCMIGKGVTRGLGTGGDPELGAAAAEADIDGIQRIVSGTDLIFLLAGAGGGTGSGAAPVVARRASEAGALVIAFVTLPFTFEGSRRQKQAEEGLALLRKECDAVIPLPNDILLQQFDDDTRVMDAFAKADDWVARGVRSIWAILSRTGLINLDFASLRQVFSNKGGKTLFGLGGGEGESAVQDAIHDLMLCPFLHTPEFSRRPDRLLINIVGGPDLGIAQVNKIMNAVNEQFGKDAHTAMGAVIDEGMAGKVEVCVLGTTDVGNRPGFFQRKSATPAARPAEPAAFMPNRPSPQPVQPAQAAPARAPASAPSNLPDEAIKSASVSTGRGQQQEFALDSGKRGYFDATDSNEFNGENLDSPTYLRRGIRVVLN